MNGDGKPGPVGQHLAALYAAYAAAGGDDRRQRNH